MKVNETSLNQAAASQLGKAREAEAAKAGGAKPASGPQPREESDRVHLSDLTGRLVQMLSTDSPDRVARVDKLAADFKAGRYQPDSQATSRGIINDAMHDEP
jgi:anti-sigma28 factor (negative regulator of flagellin synthesis)